MEQLMDDEDNEIYLDELEDEEPEVEDEEIELDELSRNFVNKLIDRCIQDCPCRARASPISDAACSPHH